MSDTDIQSCDQCGSELPRGIPSGLCPRCVLADTQDATSIVSQPLFTDVNAPQLPRSFGDYELLEEIARGGMGVVYKARQKSLERIVALKMLLFGAHSSPELVRRFRAEAVLAAGLHHPNIVAVHEVGIHDGQPFLVMDYEEGQNLSYFLRPEPISIRESVLCLHKLAVAIHYAHERNVLHRDLKPSNILLDGQREPHVTDFGLARRIDGESTITISGQVLGSPNYMPPEQAAPRKGKVSRRSDVYGLGAILYHCLTGRPPFQAESLEATLHLVVTADPVSPRLLNPSVPLDLETICLKCLEKDPARRYHTAEDLAEELSRFLNNCPIRARPTTRGEKLARWCRRNPPLAAAIGTAALFLISGLIVSMLLASQAAREASGARLHLYLANMSLARQALAQNNFSSAREKLLAHLPKKGWADLRGWEWRLLWKLGQPDNARSFNAGDSVHALALSPDGKFVAAGSRDGNVRVLDLDRGQVVTNLFASPAQPNSLLAPQATLMASVAQGVFGGGLPWVMVGFGAAIGVLIIALDEYLKASGAAWRAPVLAVAVGIYLPLELAVPIFAGGLVAHFAASRGRLAKDGNAEARLRNGVLVAAGLITGEALIGIFMAVPIVLSGDPNVIALATSVPTWIGLAVIATITAWIYRVATRS
jgi:serine/threonine protein kinase